MDLMHAHDHARRKQLRLDATDGHVAAYDGLLYAIAPALLPLSAACSLEAHADDSGFHQALASAR
jgi:hypothetical protein